jgi:hypothetical protein
MSVAMVKTTQSSQGQRLCREHSELDVVSMAGWAANLSTTTALGAMAYWVTGGGNSVNYSLREQWQSFRERR